MAGKTHTIVILYDGQQLYLQHPNGSSAEYLQLAPKDEIEFKSQLDEFELEIDKGSITPVWDVQKQNNKKLKSSKIPVDGYYTATTGPLLLLYKYSVKVKGNFPKLDPDIQIVDDVIDRPKPRDERRSGPNAISIALGVAAVAAIAGLLTSRGRRPLPD